MYIKQMSYLYITVWVMYLKQGSYLYITKVEMYIKHYIKHRSHLMVSRSICQPGYRTGKLAGLLVWCYYGMPPVYRREWTYSLTSVNRPVNRWGSTNQIAVTGVNHVHTDEVVEEARINNGGIKTWLRLESIRIG